MRPPNREETFRDEDGRVTQQAWIAAPHLFVVVESERAAARGARYALSNIDEVAIGRGPSRAASRTVAGAGRRLAVTLPDRRASTTHARLERAAGTFVAVDCGSTNGTRVNGHPIEGRVVLRDGDWIEVGHTLLRFRSALPTHVATAADVDLERREAPPGLLTLMPAFDASLEALRKVAAGTIPVLLLGETGTGKELLARAVHELSRRGGPFVAVNCAALTPTLLEAQLFGHVKGAFSGALRSEPGFVRSAHGGTLFLDEIGDLPRAAQASLLRVLQEREVVPVGASAPVAVDVRVVAATHEALREQAESGEFRHDLYARLSGWELELPTLRERIEDLGTIVAQLAPNATLGASVASALGRYEWPLNVRELQQALALAATLSSGGVLELANLPPVVAAHAVSVAEAAPLAESDDELRRRLVERLAANNGNIASVARDFGKARMQVQRWMKRFGIRPEEFRR